MIGAGVVAVPKLLDATSNKTEPVKPTTIVATSQVKGHEARLATDGFKNTYWAESAKGDGVNQTITFTFDEPGHLVWVLITAGAEKTAQPRPRLVLITFYDASGRAIDAKSTTLPDTSDPHKVRVSIAGVKRVEIKISSVYAAANKSGSTLSISEVEFERKA